MEDNPILNFMAKTLLEGNSELDKAIRENSLEPLKETLDFWMSCDDLTIDQMKEGILTEYAIKIGP